jgi:hypothetical protein
MSPLKQVLLGFCKKEMIQYLESNPADFDEAIELALVNEQPFSWRAAWLLWDVIEDNDKRIKKHLTSIIKAIPSKRYGQQRDLLRIVSMMQLDEEQEGLVYDICTKIWLTPVGQPSGRYRALLIMKEVARKYPDLKMELKIIASPEYIQTLSPGIKNAAIRLLSEF